MTAGRTAFGCICPSASMTMKSCGFPNIRSRHNIILKLLRSSIRHISMGNHSENKSTAYLRSPIMTLNAASYSTARGKPKTLRNQGLPKATFSNVPLSRTGRLMDRPAHGQPLQGTVRGASTSPKHRDVYLALGSNLGDRRAMIEAACRLMTDRGIRVLRTSHLYETEPMYVENQEKFHNGVCQVSLPDPQLRVGI